MLRSAVEVLIQSLPDLFGAVCRLLPTIDKVCECLLVEIIDKPVQILHYASMNPTFTHCEVMQSATWQGDCFVGRNILFAMAWKEYVKSRVFTGQMINLF